MRFFAEVVAKISLNSAVLAARCCFTDEKLAKRIEIRDVLADRRPNSNFNLEGLWLEIIPELFILGIG